MANKNKRRLPSTPVSRPSTATRFGKGLEDAPRRRWETGTVIGYSPATQTYTVKTSTHPGLPDVPRLVRDPGETGIIPMDTTVVLHDELGYYVIDGILKLAAANPVELTPARVSEVRGVGGEDPLHAPAVTDTTFRAPNEPKDILPNDWIRRSPDGNMIAVLAGGTNAVKSSPFAQVRTHAIGDMVEIISATYRHMTAMGDLNIVNENGKTSLIWRAGSDQSTENGPNTGNWTIRLDVGATGDLFNFEITTPKGQTLSRIHMGSDGRVSILGSAGVDVTSGDRGTTREDLAGSKETTVRGELHTKVKGLVEEVFRAARVTSVSKNDSLTVGNDRNEVVNHDRNSYVGGAQVTRAQGGVIPTPGAPAIVNEAINGSINTVVGDPASAAIPAALQGQNFINYVGGFNFALMPTAMPPPIGGFNVISAMPGSVQLGADGAAVPNPATGGYDIVAVAPFGVMKFEPFLAMMLVLITYVDTHFHGSAVGPTSPPIVPMKPLVEPLLAAIRSVRVSVGL